MQPPRDPAALEAFVHETAMAAGIPIDPAWRTDFEEKTALVHEGLRALIARESARRLANLGGSERKLRALPSRRPPARRSSR